MTPNAGFAGVADALVALVEHGEAEFAARFDKLFADVPLLPWPAWAYMSALAPIRALLPDGEQLEGLDVGPSLRVAIDAGRAVAELRRTGDPGVATTLPWDQIDLLRVHVPVPMLCELVLAASASVPAANASLSQIPDCSRWIRPLVAHPSPGVRRAADIAVKVYPPRPEHPLRITTLGRFSVECPPGTELTGWDRRERVRDLLAELVIRRSVPRSDLAAAIWPDLSPEKAANNLRVNLHHVQQLLEPGRSPDAPPAYLQGTATGLRLSTDDVTIDTDLFDARIAEALAAEHAVRRRRRSRTTRRRATCTAASSSPAWSWNRSSTSERACGPSPTALCAVAVSSSSRAASPRSLSGWRPPRSRSIRCRNGPAASRSSATSRSGRRRRPVPSPDRSAKSSPTHASSRISRLAASSNVLRPPSEPSRTVPVGPRRLR